MSSNSTTLTYSSSSSSQQQETNNVENHADHDILRDILVAMHDPKLVSNVEELVEATSTVAEAALNDSHHASSLDWKEVLSFIPWVYHCNPELNLKLISAAECERRRCSKELPNSTSIAASKTTTEGNVEAVYPSWTYLDLRDVQNHKFAQDRFLQGIQHARDKQYAKAESCYEEVLKLMPFHADCLVAYGALCASNIHGRKDSDDNDRLDKAEIMLRKALELDPLCPNAQFYLDQIAIERQKRRQGSFSSSNVLLVPQRAWNDAIVERTILNGLEDDDNSESEVVDLHNQKREKKRHRHKKQKKKHRRKRRRDDSSVSSEHADSSTQSNRERYHKRRRSNGDRRHRKAKSRSTVDSTK
eukprot:CAMPEP_0172417534 /NCGR_PEP_ID=MMETSP1064-20121228/4065_1 /TAXON_ID=202472 /ORGANISM="Aulacoseira subarctica , Strain CCAP 1002/5" /LENGTH=358 /DNA_ID=CAMNT_0013155939 /DNA_START=87 /DNA_END=1163 /DNA_ORIENTATION=-